jgi:hypothetical protein
MRHYASLFHVLLCVITRHHASLRVIMRHYAYASLCVIMRHYCMSFFGTYLLYVHVRERVEVQTTGKFHEYSYRPGHSIGPHGTPLCGPECESKHAYRRCSDICGPCL